MVDASALAMFILQEPGWERITGFLEHALSVDHVAKEVSNAVWKAYNRGFLSRSDAEEKVRYLAMLLGVNIKLVGELELLGDAVEIAMDTGVTVYDALYVALAKRESLPLLTLDAGQADAARRLGVEVVSP